MSAVGGRKALVVGAASGFGRAVVEELLVQGAVVVATDIDEPGLASLVASEPRLHRLMLDVTDDDAVVHQVGRAVELLSGLDTVVYSAGVIHQESLLSASPSHWASTLAVNLTGAFFVCQAAAGPLIESGSGRIVTLGSVAGIRPRPRLQAYSASKAGLIGLTRSLAVELAPHNVTANCICPASAPTTGMGRMLTELKRQASARETIDDALEDVAAAFPLGRYIDEKDVVGAVLYLISEYAANITGMVLTIDGGKLLTL